MDNVHPVNKPYITKLFFYAVSLQSVKNNMILETPVQSVITQASNNGAQCQGIILSGSTFFEI